MKKLLSSDQRGVGHLGAILAIVVVLALGGVGYYVFNKNKNSSPSDSSLSSTVAAAIKNAKCNFDDKDLCKFFKAFTAQHYYTVSAKSTDTSDSSANSSMTIQWQNGGSDMHFKTTANGADWEVITIGGNTYTRASDGTWWKQSAKADNAADPQADFHDYSVDTPKDNTTAQQEYKNLGKEACGNLTCFKYQDLTVSNGTTSYLWFDTKDYLLRRTLEQTGTTTTDSTFSYSKFSIAVPSPVKELGPNQYLVPGQSEPTTIPSASDTTGLTPEQIQQLQEQYGQQ